MTGGVSGSQEGDGNPCEVMYESNLVVWTWIVDASSKILLVEAMVSDLSINWSDSERGGVIKVQL